MEKPKLYCIPYNWVVVVPVTTGLFALIFYTNAVFSCSSFSAASSEANSSFQYGYWGFQYEYGDCHSFEAVDGLLRLGRVLGIFGFMIGVILLFLLSLLCCLRIPRRIVAMASAFMLGMVVFSCCVLLGAATHFCTIRNGEHVCSVGMTGYLALVAACFWLVGGISLFYIKDRFEESEKEGVVVLSTAGADGTLSLESLDKATASEEAQAATGDDSISNITLRKQVDEECPPAEESTIGATSKAMSPSVVVEREYFLDGREVVRTTKTSVRADGTQVIETDTVRSNKKQRAPRRTKKVDNKTNKPAAPSSSCHQWICEDLAQCQSTDDYNATRDFQSMTLVASGLTDETGSHVKYNV